MGRSAAVADVAIVDEPGELCLTVARRGFAWFALELTGRSAYGFIADADMPCLVLGVRGGNPGCGEARRHEQNSRLHTADKRLWRKGCGDC